MVQIWVKRVRDKAPLRRRVLLNIGDKPLTARDLWDELNLIWKASCPWKLVSLGRGVYEFQFGSYEDMRLTWSMGTNNLKLDTVFLSKWTNYFNLFKHQHTHLQIWTRLMEATNTLWDCKRERYTTFIGQIHKVPLFWSLRTHSSRHGFVWSCLWWNYGEKGWVYFYAWSGVWTSSGLLLLLWSHWA
jgi:hypothetical protein